jgi:hypothetical protein
MANFKIQYKWDLSTNLDKEIQRTDVKSKLIF